MYRSFDILILHERISHKACRKTKTNVAIKIKPAGDQDKRTVPPFFDMKMQDQAMSFRAN